MKRALRPVVFALVGTIALGAGIWFALKQRQTESPEVADNRAINFALPDLDGYSRELAGWHGKYVLLNFWATWCQPCREEIPLLKNAQAKYGAHGFQVIGVAIDSEEAVSAYHRDVQFTYPVLIGEIEAVNLLAAFGHPSGALPFTVLISPDGRILHRKVGAYRAEELETFLTTTLGTPVSNEEKH